MKRIICLTYIIAILMTCGCTNSSTSGLEITNTLSAIQNSITEADIAEFQQSTNEILYVSRWFSSGIGTRGKDISFLVNKNSITENISFSVEDESPIEVSKIFPNFLSADVKEIKQIATQENIDINTSFGVSQNVQLITEFVLKNQLSYEKPFIISGNDFLILTDVSKVSDMLVGGIMVFKKYDNHYLLNYIFDLR